MFKRRFKGISRGFHGYFKEVQRVFQESFKDTFISYKIVSRMPQGSFKKAVEGRWKSVSRELYGSLKRVSMVFKRNSKGLSINFKSYLLFLECLEKMARTFVSSLFRGCLNSNNSN